jgi:hypothetical protein
VKILHINQSDISGGAAIADYRLHQGLLVQGIDLRLLVGIVKTSSFNIPEHRFYQGADVLNFHNLHTGYFNYLAIPLLTEK